LLVLQLVQDFRGYRIVVLLLRLQLPEPADQYDDGVVQVLLHLVVLLPMHRVRLHLLPLLPLVRTRRVR
jgi:hypothetical protein